MLALFAALKTSRFWLKIAPYIAAAALVLGFVLWIRGMQHSIADLRTENATLKQGLANETAARERDVSALTALSAGLTKAATDTKKDAQVLQETVKDATAPASPQLRAFLDGLRAADAASAAAGTASSPRR